MSFGRKTKVHFVFLRPREPRAQANSFNAMWVPADTDACAPPVCATSDRALTVWPPSSMTRAASCIAKHSPFDAERELPVPDVFRGVPPEAQTEPCPRCLPGCPACQTAPAPRATQRRTSSTRLMSVRRATACPLRAANTPSSPKWPIIARPVSRGVPVTIAALPPNAPAVPNPFYSLRSAPGSAA